MIKIVRIWTFIEHPVGLGLSTYNVSSPACNQQIINNTIVNNRDDLELQWDWESRGETLFNNLQLSDTRHCRLGDSQSKRTHNRSHLELTQSQ